MSRFNRFQAVLMLLPFFAAGCGGGGGGSASVLPGDRTAEVAVFATDSFRDDYDQVWVTIHKVELLNSAGQAETAFVDDAGRVLDLRTLRDAAGERFELLADGRVRPGTYSSVRVTIGESINAVPRGASAAQSIPISTDVPRDSSGRPTIQFPLQSPRNLSGPGGSIIVDFDLANFVLAGGKIRPALREAISQILPNADRHERNHFNGVVTNLSATATGTTFLLQLANGLLLPVAASTETVIYHASGAPNVELANGQHVKVEGAFDLGSRHFRADEIKVEAFSGGDHHDGRAFVIGVPLRWDSTAGTFVVRIIRVEGFVPRTRELLVRTTESTVFHDRSGLVISRVAFFEGLAHADIVKAAGIYDRESNTFTAKHARLGHGGHEPRHVRAVGKPIEIQAGERRFHLNPVYEYEGFRPGEHGVRVVTTNTTRFMLRNGEVITPERFFELLPFAARVLVEGTYNREANTITAAVARIVESHEPPRNVSAAGPPVEVSPDRRAFDIRPVDDHSGFDPPDRGVHVITTNATVFRGRDGQVITVSAFFELLRTASRVRVEGAYNRETNTITAAVAVIVAVHSMALAVGQPTEVNGERGVFTINPVIEWTGFTPRDHRVLITTTHETVFRNAEGHVISAAEFFRLLREAHRVRVEGRYSGETNSIAAVVAQIRAL